MLKFITRIVMTIYDLVLINYLLNILDVIDWLNLHGGDDKLFKVLISFLLPLLPVIIYPLLESNNIREVLLSDKDKK